MSTIYCNGNAGLPCSSPEAILNLSSLMALASILLFSRAPSSHASILSLCASCLSPSLITPLKLVLQLLGLVIFSSACFAMSLSLVYYCICTASQWLALASQLSNIYFCCSMPNFLAWAARSCVFASIYLTNPLIYDSLYRIVSVLALTRSSKSFLIPSTQFNLVKHGTYSPSILSIISITRSSFPAASMPCSSPNPGYPAGSLASMALCCRVTAQVSSSSTPPATLTTRSPTMASPLISLISTTNAYTLPCLRVSLRGMTIAPVTRCDHPGGNSRYWQRQGPRRAQHGTQHVR